MKTVQTITVCEDDDGQRLDRWLKKNVPQLSYVLAQKLVRKGQIRVDGKRAKGDMKLTSGQAVRIPPVDVSKVKSAPSAKPSKADADFIRSLVIYDDGEILAFNKPHGLAVQGGSKTRRHMDAYFPALKNDKGVAPRLVHRLDKDTSGLLLTARSAAAAKALGEMLKKRQVKKIYLAVTVGVPELREGTVKAPLVKGAKGAGKEKMHIDAKDGKTALTDYIVLDHAHDQAALVAFWPRTGRTHQIRAHAAYMGCPVLGDRKYGGSAAVIEGMDLPGRLHLHALRVICKHPFQKGDLDISAPLPADLKKSFKILGFPTRFKHDPFEEE